MSNMRKTIYIKRVSENFESWMNSYLDIVDDDLAERQSRVVHIVSQSCVIWLFEEHLC